MNFLYKEKKQNEQGILSATKPKETILNINTNKQTELKTILKQKKKITIYIEDKKYFVEHSTAFALGLINTRAIMLDNPRLVEISYDVHNKLCKNNDIEINYVQVENKKQKLRVFVSSSSYYIENSAAYSLGLLTVEEFNNSDEKYYFISESMLPVFKNKYDVEMVALNLFEEKNSKSK